jgi:hypothetical protein
MDTFVQNCEVEDTQKEAGNEDVDDDVDPEI